MNYPRYDYSEENELSIFEFDSIGKKGKITKLVQYTEMSVKGYYNLGFGDLDLETREINDEIITNNGDGQKVLATVVSTFIHSQENTQKPIFMQLEVVNPERDYTEWALLITSKNLKKIS